VVWVAVLAVVFALVTGVVVLRFMFLVRQLVDSIRLDHAEQARRLDAARAGAFTDAMTALEAVQDRVVSSQSRLLERTVDVVAGPHGGSGEPLAVDEPSLDARPAWIPDDEWDYTGLGIDPTDESLPMPRLEPEGNAHRATMVRPGEGLAPG
jgi:hypothetical protein